jgi:gentisate 1,2-dioxygenase
MTEFHDAMTAAGVKALWEQQDRHHFPPEPAHLWPWHSINPLIDAAIAATDMHNAERRVLILNNPIFHGSERDGAVVNLAVNLQVLMPGERARPHRHSMHP